MIKGSAKGFEGSTHISTYCQWVRLGFKFMQTEQSNRNPTRNEKLSQFLKNIKWIQVRKAKMNTKLSEAVGEITCTPSTF